MKDDTALDRAHAAMEAAPEDARARLSFYERLADAELFLMLTDEPDNRTETVSPEVFDLENARYVLAFDREARLAEFAGQITPYVALSGRGIVSMLAGQGIGLGVNLEVAPSQMLLPAEAIIWLNETLGNLPDQEQMQISEVHPPRGLPETLVTALDAKLATAMGLADCAYLAAVTQVDGARGHLLAFVGAVPDAEGALAQAVGESLTFSGIEAGVLDVSFFHRTDSIVSRLERVGLRFDLPQLQQRAPRAAPGSDPAQPPKLR
ncbi:MAG: SseB family protein [Pseudomonadota bacterium]